MLCPVCRHDNFEGEDSCENCGADLASSGVSEPPTDFIARLLGEHLDALVAEGPSLVEAATPVATVIRRMRADGVDCVLVMSGERLVGIFTERDAVLKVAGRASAAFDVRDVMTGDPVVLRRDDSLAVAINKMAVGGFRHIPIVDGDRPMGVVAARDVFHHILRAIG